MPDFDKDDALKNLERINSWISNSDTKTSFMLAFIGIVVGLTLANSEFTKGIIEIIKAVKQLSQADLKNIASVSFLVIFIGFLFFIGSSIRFFLRVLQAKNNIQEFHDKGVITDSILFYGRIRELTLSQFNDKATSISANNLYKDINSQTLINSIICDNKFKNYNKGLKYLKVALIILSVLIVLFYLIQ